MVNGVQLLTIFGESSITDVRIISKYGSDKDNKYDVNFSLHKFLSPLRHFTVKRLNHLNLGLVPIFCFLQGGSNFYSKCN